MGAPGTEVNDVSKKNHHCAGGTAAKGDWGYQGCRVGLVLLAVTGLSGCLFGGSPPPTASLVTPAAESAPAETVGVPPTPTRADLAATPAAGTSGEVRSMAQCDKALASLRAINPASYQKKKAYFDSLVSSVSRYGDIRNAVSDSTRETVDALYKFKAGKVCADIENEVMNGLVSKAERGAP